MVKIKEYISRQNLMNMTYAEWAGWKKEQAL